MTTKQNPEEFAPYMKLTRRQVYLINLLAKGALNETVYEPKTQLDYVREAIEGIRDAAAEAVDPDTYEDAAKKEA